ncbi:hypothetical protein CcI156_17740 [Frankia sp. CcI156]|uniref:hypothetical protein n=1 Tax=Frankia TaxID=1854 RepID=UPI0003CFC78D|nr:MULTISPECIES: hypothetical protein [Frankia]ETA01236.1 hypothetical protein CcI6DRAFT_03359 [Frankia sp. CcI6]KFB04681.1 hypothetical protein ALLO2DRAFT_02611 [Frankia sp. Allo2]OAA22579.1 hypothetical protein AAY23_106219 [Frankia casuarinae]OFB42218.1 hypothetical protein Manayef4_15300 [Frankia sp. CgIM4]OHV52800.1 hypothetical protein CgIS1_16110 [Frankia sp. CgIS1]
MRDATNLNWIDTPFGGARRPFANRASLLAAFTINAADDSPAAAAVYLPLPQTRPLKVADTTVRFGFHAVAAEGRAEAAAVVASVDALFVQARRQAAILAGHRLAGELAALTATSSGQVTRGITAVAGAWNGQPPKPGLARLYETASEPAPATLADVCAAHRLHGLSLDASWVAAGSSWSGSQILRHLVTRALAIALIAAGSTSHYQWNALHLDTVIEATAWDQFTELCSTPVP